MLEAIALCVASVTDGNLFDLLGDTVRLVSASGPIDAPELRFQRERWNDLALAKEARQRLSEMFVGGRMDCNGRDRYQRMS